MRHYDEILDLAVSRKGGREAVLAGIPEPSPPEVLAAIADACWLQEMARGIFRVGLNWSVVDNKWAGILEAFDQFAIGPNAFMAEERFEALMQDTRIIRSGPKVRAIQHNAALIQQVSAAHGSFGQRIADWPAEDFAGLLKWLQKDGARLGGSVGAYMLRSMGKESFILSKSVIARLVAEGVIDKAPTSQKAMVAVQEAFNTWKEQSGENLTTLSRVLAQSID